VHEALGTNGMMWEEIELTRTEESPFEFPSLCRVRSRFYGDGPIAALLQRSAT
jgi:hypothetical protein